MAATALAGAWRASPPSLSLCQEQLSQITPALLATGAGALLWWRIKDSHLGAAPAAAELRRTYLFYKIEAARHLRGIEETVVHLRANSVEPLMAKGLFFSRLYPEPGLRPFGDLDLCVPAKQYWAAREALALLRTTGPSVDLHRRFFELRDRGLDDLYRRSQPLPVGQSTVRVLGPADHLRLACLHLVHHAAHRPLWLCDIALLVESLSPDFDWDYFLSGDKKNTGWAIGALLLARDLLGARLDGAPAAITQRRVPGWLVTTVMEQWGRGADRAQPMGAYVRHPAGTWREVRRRWPTALEATDALRLPLNAAPRVPFQLAWFLWLLASFAPKKIAGVLYRMPRRPAA